MKRGFIVQLFAGPGTGKSTTAADLFAKCKQRGYNTEIIREFAKDAAWEGRGDKFFNAQSYIFGCQYFNVTSVIDEVEFAITDSPLLMSSVYVPDEYPAPAIKAMILEHHNSFETLNIFLKRTKPYNPKGRYQTEEEAKELDEKIKKLLLDNYVPFYEIECGRDSADQILKLMAEEGWISEKAEDISLMSQRFEWIANNLHRFASLHQSMKDRSGYDMLDAIDVAIKTDKWK